MTTSVILSQIIVNNSLILSIVSVYNVEDDKRTDHSVF